MKKILFLFLTIALTLGCANAYPIDINYNDGIYHIVLKGEKIKMWTDGENYTEVEPTDRWAYIELPED